LDDLTALRVYEKTSVDQRLIVVCHDREPLFWHELNGQANTSHAFQQFCRYWQVDFPETHWPWTDTLCSWIRADFPGNVTGRGIILHSEPQSHQLAQLGEHWLPVELWSQALIAQDWYRYAQHDPVLTNGDYKFDFLVYSRAWTGSREYRLWFLHQIIRHDLTKVSRIKFAQHDQQQHCSQHQFRDQAWQCDTAHLPEHFIDNHSSADASATYDSHDLNQCRVEVVLETVVDRVHLTEKICRALACGKPFVLLSGMHALRWLRGWGFQTFDPWLDETYDTIADTKHRLEHVLMSMRTFADLPRDRKTKVMQQINAVAKSNQRRFFSDEFRKQICDRFVGDFNAASDIIASGPTLDVSEIFLRHCGSVARDLGIR
jgi:hypothetical protein